MANTIMTGTGRENNSHVDEMTNYALFMGGTNTRHEVLRAYDPLTTGYARIFMVRKPAFLLDTFKNDNTFNAFKHLLEYGFTAVGGINNIDLQENTMQGGYTNRAFGVPSLANDTTTEFNIQVYEFSSSPVRTVLHSWINGISDLLTGVTHLNGADVEATQANMTAEFIYYVTDRTTRKIEYACLFTNCYPKNIDLDPFNYQSGEHNIVQTTIQFSTVKYESIQINRVAAELNKKYRILSNSLNYYSGYKLKGDTAPTGSSQDGDLSVEKMETKNYNPETGQFIDKDVVIDDTYVDPITKGTDEVPSDWDYRKSVAPLNVSYWNEKDPSLY